MEACLGAMTAAGQRRLRPRMLVHSVYLGELGISPGKALRDKHHSDLNAACFGDRNVPAVAVSVFLPKQQKNDDLGVPDNGST